MIAPSNISRRRFPQKENNLFYNFQYRVSSIRNTEILNSCLLTYHTMTGGRHLFFLKKYCLYLFKSLLFPWRGGGGGGENRCGIWVHNEQCTLPSPPGEQCWQHPQPQRPGVGKDDRRDKVSLWFGQCQDENHLIRWRILLNHQPLFFMFLCLKMGNFFWW